MSASMVGWSWPSINRGKLVVGQADTVVGEAVLGKVIGTDLLGTVPGAICCLRSLA